MRPAEFLDTLLLYHLMEATSGSATRVDVQLEPDGTLQTSDDGRGMGTDRVVGGRAYVDLVLGQLELLDEEGAFDPEWLQLHAVGQSLAVRASERFELHIRRAGQRREGVWDPAQRRVDWRPAMPCHDHGTTIRARLRDGRVTAGDLRTRIQSLARRLPNVAWGLTTPG